MSTLVQLRDLIKANTGIKKDRNFTNPLLNRWINDAQRDIQLKLFHLGYTEFRGSDSLTLSSGTLGGESVKTAPLSSDVPTRMGVPNWLLYIDASIPICPCISDLIRIRFTICTLVLRKLGSVCESHNCSSFDQTIRSSQRH